MVKLIAEDSVVVVITTASMLIEVKTITKALRYLQSEQYRRAIIVTDSMSTLQKIKKSLMQTGVQSSTQANLIDSLGFSVQSRFTGSSNFSNVR